jgi:hypothetical protein
MYASSGGKYMRKTIEMFLAAAALFLVTAVSSFGSGSLTGPGTIRVTDMLVKHLHVDVGRAGRGAGDIDFFRQSLFNKGVTPNPIGHSDVTCVHTGTGSQNCTGTYFLPRGKIMVAGVIGSRLFYELAVLGGTGLYDNARGTVTATYLGGDPAREFLLFRLDV